MFVTGSGAPLVLIPGIQGRWEWMKPAVTALARDFQVITFSLVEKGPSAELFGRLVGQVEEALDRMLVARAVVCGVSYGGLIALHFAATRPGRVGALVLASTPGPRWKADERVDRYASSPWRSVPRFIAGATARLFREIAVARPDRLDRYATVASYLWSIATHPSSPPAMAARVHALAGHDFAADARAVRAPTLVLTGERGLDRVVPVEGTREYLALIPECSGRMLDRTGHIGLVTRSHAFAAAIREFAYSATASVNPSPAGGGER